MPNAKIKQLTLYPVKSLQGITLTQAKLTAKGFEYDREWMITNEDFKFLTQRDLSKMASIKTQIDNQILILSTQNQQSCQLDMKITNQAKVLVKVWRDEVWAYDEGNEISQWLTKTLGLFQNQKLKLVRVDSEKPRVIQEELHKGNNETVGFADAYPYLIANQQSLDILNKQLLKQSLSPIPIQRFRANIVVDGLNPFDEHSMKQAYSVDNKYQFNLSKDCQRCIMPTIDQSNGEKDLNSQILKSLAQINSLPNRQGVYFGVNALLNQNKIESEVENKIMRIGDELIFS